MRERRRSRHALRAGGGQGRAAQGGEALLERRQRREQQFDVVELQGTSWRYATSPCSAMPPHCNWVLKDRPMSLMSSGYSVK